jgi:lysozyme family protein
MADFYQAYAKTMKFEGGYVNDPNDAGGETYKGISRRYNPSWEGWAIIDNYRETDGNFPKCLDMDSGLQTSVKMFYKQQYWDRNLLDEFNDQELAEEMFDTGVNMGISRAAKFLQEGMNYLNKNGELYSDVDVDGKIGDDTMAGLAFLEQNGDIPVLYKIINILQGMHYLNYMNNSPNQERYARGWLSRVQFSKRSR